ncbi:MAG: PQQ-dependent sugar dehydrogenase, partial [Planctomycetota bacterium]
MSPRVVPAVFAFGLVTSLACGQADLDGPVEQTGASPAAQGWTSVEVVGGLERPWGLAFLPDGSMLVTEKAGRLRVVDSGGNLVKEPVAGLPEIYSRGQGGLMDVVLHPEFEATRWVYLTHSAGTRNSNYTVMIRGKLSDDMTRLEDVERLFEVAEKKPGGQHFGSRILWLDDGTLLLSIGDGGNPPTQVDGKLARLHAQDLDSHLGKTLRLDEHGRPAPANPFMDDPDNYGGVFTYGHRNIQGMAIHPETRDVWATEHGA